MNNLFRRISVRERLLHFHTAWFALQVWEQVIHRVGAQASVMTIEAELQAFAQQIGGK